MSSRLWFIFKLESSFPSGCSEFPNLEWNEKIEFNIEMNDLPRRSVYFSQHSQSQLFSTHYDINKLILTFSPPSARLCCIICSKNSRSNQGMFGGRRRNVSTVRPWLTPTPITAAISRAPRFVMSTYILTSCQPCRHCRHRSTVDLNYCLL